MGNCCGRSRRNFPFPSAIAKRCNTTSKDEDSEPSVYQGYLPPDHNNNNQHQNNQGEIQGKNNTANNDFKLEVSSSSKSAHNNKSSKNTRGSQRSQKSNSKNSSKRNLESNQNHAYDDHSSGTQTNNNNYLSAEHAEILSQISGGQDPNNNTKKARAVSNSPLFSKEGIQHIRDREEPEELDEDLHPSDLSNTRTFFLSKALDDSRKLTTNKGSEKGKTSMHKQFSSTERLEK